MLKFQVDSPIIFLVMVYKGTHTDAHTDRQTDTHRDEQEYSIVAVDKPQHHNYKKLAI